MKTTILLLLLVYANSLCAQKWVCTTKDNYWQSRQITFQHNTEASNQNIVIHPDSQFQEIDGWGGSFNEIGWAALLALDETGRQNVLKAIFDPEKGLKFNICRVPMGASDFTVDNIHQAYRYKHLNLDEKYNRYYSLNDTPGDFEMNDFSIERDRKFLLPFIKAAMKYRPDLKIWGSPWTPPHWMMTNFANKSCDSTENYAGFFKGYYGESEQEKYRKAYADYFAEFVKAYRNEGIDLYAVHVQNEYSLLQYWVSCVFTGNDMENFIGNYLGPRFNNKAYSDYSVLKDIEIWLGTVHPKTWEPVMEFNREVLPVIQPGSESLKYTEGIGFQYKGFLLLDTVRQYNDNLKLMASETKCGKGNNTWEYGLLTWDEMKNYLEAGVHSYMQWNMILDQYTTSSFQVRDNCEYWAQNSMITINTENKQVVHNPQFYTVKHFSYYIQPGAKRIRTHSNMDGIDVIAFSNPDGSLVINVKNALSEEVNVPIEFREKKIFPVIPSGSMNTFVFE